MEISTNDYDSLNSIFQKLKKDNKYLIEINFEGKMKIIERAIFERVLKQLIYKESNGGLQWNFKMNTKFTIKTQDNDYFVEISDIDRIKKLWQFGKDTIDPENKDFRMINIKETINNESNGIVFNLIEQFSKAVDKKFVSDLDNEKITKEYQYLNVYEICEPKYNYKINLIEQRRIESTKTFKESHLLENTPIYGLSIEIDNDIITEDRDISDLLNNLANIIKWIREIIQGTKFVISSEDQNRVIDSFRKLTKVNDSMLKNEHFILAEPVDILRRNFHEKDSSAYVKENYAITYLPHGVLSFLYVPENYNKSIDNKIFVIDRTFNVLLTGKEMKNFENTLLEGYFVKHSNMFYMTDILFFKGEDIRLTKFFVKNKPNEKTRFDKLLQFYREGIQKSQYTNSELGDSSVILKLSHYLFGEGNSFSNNLKELLENTTSIDFELQGLYLKSYNEHYPLKGGYSYQLFKWRFPQFRTIEFLVRTEKDGSGNNDKVSPLQLKSDQKDLYGKIIYYKTLNLNIGGYRNVYDQKKKEYKKIFTITSFSPKTTSESEDNIIGKANIPLDNMGKMMAKNNITGMQEEINDETIVEFAFTKMYGDQTNEFLWTPISIDNHKTKQYKDGDIVYGTSETYANHMWSALSNPISVEMLIEDRVPEEEVSKYYETNSFRFKKYPYQTFHNQVVKEQLIKNASPAIINNVKGTEGSLLDLASGIGGDFMKWKLARLEKIIGVEYNKENIEYALDSYKKAARPKPFAQFIWGDASKLIFPDFASAMDHNAKVLMKKTFLSKYQFNVVSCQFALHYFFVNEIAIRSFLQNVNDNLKIGGFFVGTSFDGKRLFETLKGMKKPLEGFVGDDLVWKITKKYTIRTFDENKANFGHSVDVFIPTIGTTNVEYLVSYGYFKTLAKEYGLELVHIKGFGEVYNGVNNSSQYYNAIKSMSDSEKQFSFLNNEFKFVKKENTSDKTYKKLMDLIAKEEKKGKKEGAKTGGRIKIVIRSASPGKKNKKTKEIKEVKINSSDVKVIKILGN
jgi:hypothetical protein